MARAVPLLTAWLALAGAALPPRLGFNGLPPVRIGMTVAEAERAMHAHLLRQGPNDADGSDCAIATAQGGTDPYSFMIEEGRITRVDLGGRGITSPIRTDRGIGLGSTLGQVRRAYAGQGSWFANAYDDTPEFEIKSPNRASAMLFETEHGRVVHIHAGRLPSAEYIEGCE